MANMDVSLDMAVWEVDDKKFTSVVSHHDPPVIRCSGSRWWSSFVFGLESGLEQVSPPADG